MKLGYLLSQLSEYIDVSVLLEDEGREVASYDGKNSIPVELNDCTVRRVVDCTNGDKIILISDDDYYDVKFQD